MSIGSGIEEKINDWFAAKAGINCIRGHFFYKPALGRDSIVVDLGGNKGSFSKGISEMFRCKVFAVEPEPNLFRQIPCPFLRRFHDPAKSLPLPAIIPSISTK